MSIFEFVAVAVSIILGLGITRLLSASIDLFRFRKRTRMHWVPITWAVVVFLTQVFFWWQFFGVTVEVWLFFDFVLTIATVLCLFVAASLVLPAHWSEGDVDLFAFFRAEGRWGIAAYAAFAVIAIAYNNRIYGIPFMNLLTPVSLVLAVLALGVVLGRSRRWVGVCTLLWLAAAVGPFLLTYFPTFQD
jgi:hypothetical protein